jgi:DMSO/TMAO reductase YedYZ heme-binding membrane subunit
VLCLASVVGVAAGLVTLFDEVLSARVESGNDYALRLSVLLPYVGVDGSYVFARALGLTALVTAAASVVLGLEIARRRDRGSPVRSGLGTLHRQLSLTTLALVAAHATVPYLSAVPPYGGWTTALVPFAQPVSWGTRAMVSESLGILAFYLLLVLGPTYYVLRQRRRLWSAVHGLTIAAYVLAVAHVLFLGSDFYVAGPARVALIAVQVPIAALMAARLQASTKKTRRRLGVAGLWLGLTCTLGLAVVAGFGVAGATLGGARL